MSEEKFDDLLFRIKAEREDLGNDFQLPLFLDLNSTIFLVSNLQLALRHPGNKAPSTEIAADIVAGVIARLREAGYLAHAELAELGNYRRFDA